ncbi:MAG: hypothetical protein B7X60_00075 [Polynucleobacter sp. 39-45-136]|nr:MAG: hypothetical protein B7X60_00075 [Polynucleobacter sp. 39-45-136]
MKNNKFPNVTKELLDELERRFPNNIPAQLISLDEFRVIQGHQEVIRLLRHQFDMQNKTILEN